MSINMKKIAGFTLLLLVAPFAEAHTGLAQNGFLSGLSHPLLGLDHLLAMLAVGLWAGSMGDKASWRLPLVFLVIMAISAIGAQGLGSMLMIENGIAVSLLLLGLFIVFAVKLPAVIGLIAVSLFAVFHGVAHGIELPLAASPLWYVSGFVFSTVLLMGLGVKTGSVSAERVRLMVRVAGVLIASAGGLMLLTN
ncbi:MAG: HupE/UreJ family protein [Pseudomonadota bacterium]|nr:HupE/UreJ family protein [Pseudomonadota bacterium]